MALPQTGPSSGVGAENSALVNSVGWEKVLLTPCTGGALQLLRLGSAQGQKHASKCCCAIKAPHSHSESSQFQLRGRDTVKGHSEHTQEPGWPCHGQTASLGAGFDVLLGCFLCVSLRKMRERQINPCPAWDCSRKSCSVFLGYRLQKDAGSPSGNPTLGIQPCCHLSPAYGTRENPSQQLGNISMECEEHCPHLRL